MSGTSLLTLIDDIATLLDDVAALSKTAAQKTAGLLGDDLAVNAEQVCGVASERELPVVWAVAKGSFINKVILVPAALLISAFIPWLLTPLLLLGGAFLCFEGLEKVIHWIFHKKEEQEDHQKLLQAITQPDVDMVEFERKKIKGAIRTDFILSAEIVVIALGTVVEKSIVMQALVVSTVAVGVTVGVYGFVGLLVKIDDAGLALVQNNAGPDGSHFMTSIGKGLLGFAPRLMKGLTIFGTLAMFLVGGGIFTHSIPFLHHLLEVSAESAEQLPAAGHFISGLTPTVINFIVGIIIGAIAVGIVTAFEKLKTK